MEVFISWSGHRSEMVAKALAELLPDAIQDSKAWMSEHDIAAGARWGQELHRQLESSTFGILCLTPENIGAPWLLFEAGSLAKSLSDPRVVPYRLNLAATDVPFPLAQFQGVDADEPGTKKLIESLNVGLNQPMDAGRLDRVFQRWWPDLSARIAAIPESLDGQPPHRTDRELLEELLKLVRDNARSHIFSLPASSVDPQPARRDRYWQIQNLATRLIEAIEAGVSIEGIPEKVDFLEKSANYARSRGFRSEAHDHALRNLLSLRDLYLKATTAATQPAVEVVVAPKPDPDSGN